MSDQSRLKGLVTYGPRQSLTSFASSVDEFSMLGIDLDLVFFNHLFWRSPLRALSNDRNLLNKIRERDYDFIIFNSGASLLYRPHLFLRLLDRAQTTEVPIFVLWRNAASKFQEIKKVVSLRDYSDVLSALRHSQINHLCISEQTRRDVREEVGFSSSRIVYNCKKVPEEYAVPVEPESPPIVLNVASIGERKGPDVFLKIADLVCARHDTVKFIWVGARATKEIDQRIVRSGLIGRVQFIDYVRDPLSYMKSASLFLLTSHQEAFGLVLAEAMACYRTVMCFSGTGAAEVCGSTGYVIPAGDLGQAAEMILQHLANPRHTLINNDARLRYQEYFSPAVYAKRFSEIIINECRLRCSGSKLT